MSARPIDLLYSCSLCGLRRVKVSAPQRADGQDIVEWVQQVAAVVIAIDHKFRSPTCQSKTISEMLIPVPEGTPNLGQNPRD